MVKALTRITLALLALVSFGIVVPTMWEWFMVPFGVMSITFFHALGLSSLIFLLTIKSNDMYSAVRNKDENDEHNTMVSLTWILMLWIMFGISAIYHAFM